MEKQLRDYVEELLKDYDKLYDLLWDMMAEAYTTKQNYLAQYRLMVWEDGSITTNFMQQNERFRGEDEGTAYCIATIKEWNSDEHDEWAEDNDTTIDTGKWIMEGYSEEINYQIDDLIEIAIDDFNNNDNE